VVADPKDPDLTQADYDAQFQMSMAAADTAAAVRAGLQRLRSVREQVDSLLVWAAGSRRSPGRVPQMARALDEGLAALEGEFTSRDLADGPAGHRTVPGLDRQYGSLLGYLNGGGGYGPGSTEGRPTAAAWERQRDLDKEWSDLSRRLERLLTEDLAALNAEVERVGGKPIGSGSPASPSDGGQS
jgi:hypothetical protein